MTLGGQMCLLPGFDLDSFPFIAVQGVESINLINLKRSNFDSLIEMRVTCQFCQKGFYFELEEYGFSLNFTHSLSSDLSQFSWIKMPFRKEFSETLARLGSLPLSRLEDIIQLQVDSNTSS